MSQDNTPLPDAVPVNLPEELPLASRLALERTRGAYERTLMAWVRTGTSLIMFGFTVYKFFQLELADINSTTVPLVQTALLGPREFGLILIGIGLLALLLGAFDHWRDLRALHHYYPGMPRSSTRLIATLIGLLGLLAFVGVIYRF